MAVPRILQERSPKIDGSLVRGHGFKVKRVASARVFLILAADGRQPMCKTINNVSILPAPSEHAHTGRQKSVPADLSDKNWTSPSRWAFFLMQFAGNHSEIGWNVEGNFVSTLSNKPANAMLVGWRDPEGVAVQCSRVAAVWFDCNPCPLFVLRIAVIQWVKACDSAIFSFLFSCYDLISVTSDHVQMLPEVDPPRFCLVILFLTDHRIYQFSQKHVVTWSYLWSSYRTCSRNVWVSLASVTTWPPHDHPRSTPCRDVPSLVFSSFMQRPRGSLWRPHNGLLPGVISRQLYGFSDMVLRRITTWSCYNRSCPIEDLARQMLFGSSTSINTTIHGCPSPFSITVPNYRAISVARMLIVAFHRPSVATAIKYAYGTTQNYCCQVRPFTLNLRVSFARGKGEVKHHPTAGSLFVDILTPIAITKFCSQFQSGWAVFPDVMPVPSAAPWLIPWPTIDVRGGTFKDRCNITWMIGGAEIMTDRFSH